VASNPFFRDNFYFNIAIIDHSDRVQEQLWSSQSHL